MHLTSSLKFSLGYTGLILYHFIQPIKFQTFASSFILEKHLVFIRLLQLFHLFFIDVSCFKYYKSDVMTLIK